MPQPTILSADDWLMPAQAARLLECSPQTVRRMADRGELSSIRTAFGRLISREAVAARIGKAGGP